MDPELQAAVDRVQDRLRVTVERAVKLYCDETQAQVHRDVCRAFLYDVHKRRPEFLLAAIRNNDVRELETDDPVLCKRFELEQLIVYPPSRWEFEHVDVFGTVSDAFPAPIVTGRAIEFIGVHPLLPEDPLISQLEPWRCLLRHKPTSLWYQKFKRRQEIRNQLGRFRPLVNSARKMTKKDFLDHFYRRPTPWELLQKMKITPDRGSPFYHDPTGQRKRVTHLEAHQLLNLTGYSPEDFWREVQHPNTLPPRRPQLELTL